MLLSIQQKFILDALKKLGCVRRRQLHALVKGRFQADHFEITQARMDAMLHQLCMGTIVCMDDGMVWLDDERPDCRRLEAIDVMLELTGGKPQLFSTKVEPPRLLRFAYRAHGAAGNPVPGGCPALWTGRGGHITPGACPYQ